MSAETWTLRNGDCLHRVLIADAGLRRRVGWSVDGVEVAVRLTSDDRVVLVSPAQGAVLVRLPTFVGPARRVSLFEAVDTTTAEVRAHAGLGGVDLVPEPGSRAARRDARIREHPRRYAAQRVALAAVGVAAALLASWLLAHTDLPRLPWPELPWPELPDIPWPQIPWPELPAIPWPDWQPPAWLRQAAGVLGSAWPVLAALLVAWTEVRRRRQQDRRRPQEAETGDTRGQARPEPPARTAPPPTADR